MTAQGALQRRDGGAGAPEVFRLRERVAELEETIRQLLFRQPLLVLPPALRLSRTQVALLVALHRRAILTQEAGFSIMEAVNRRCAEHPEWTLPQQVFQMRARLRPHRVEIATVWGQGYALAPESRGIVGGWIA